MDNKSEYRKYMQNVNIVSDTKITSYHLRQPDQ